MALILASGYLCLHSALASQKLIEPRVEILQNARVAMATMAADLRAACPLSKDIDLLGMQRTLGEFEADNLDFGTHNYTPRHPNEGDFCQVSYFMARDSTTGQFLLLRRRNPRIAPDPLSGGSLEELARGLLGLRFEYYDGLDWYGTWGDLEGKAQTSLRLRSNVSGLPEAVRITLWLDSNPRTRTSDQTAAQTNREPPLVFQTIARINLAANARRNATAGGATTSESQDNSAQPGPAQPGQGGSQ
jgi:hypothetical protein